MRDERVDVADRVTELLWAIDAQDWPAIRACFGETVRTDYTSLFGGEPLTQTADQLIAGWRSLLPGFDATQHLLGPLLVTVDGARATARCAVTATHQLGDDSWVVGGHYVFELGKGSDRWTIESLTFRKAFVIGGDAIPDQARRRAAGKALTA